MLEFFGRGRRLSRWLGGLGLLASWPGQAAAPAAPPRPVVILFVGNSFTHGKYQPVLQYNAAGVTDENHNLPAGNPRRPRYAHEPGPWGGIAGIFQRLTAEAGLRYEVHLEAVSGQTLQFHHDSARSVIDRPAGWDAVVLQEYSTRPLPVRRRGQPALFADYATRLEQLVHARNPRARVFLYQTWPRADQVYPAAAPYYGLPLDSMTRDLHRGYYALARQNRRIKAVAPAGDAWLRAVQQGVAQRNPYAPEAGKVDLWGADHYHPGNAGAYLNACVLFAQITGRDPRRLGPREQAAADLGLSPDVARQLQRVAYEQVKAGRKAQ
ncbi:DUF4886 domain-containing protein [Hymenobacter edaphi]|uniref:PEP-CTERM sorting domain-containing protein n=1 Tax=Hymenobacter edaphi TaxID=2211146 RepID=A0A328BT34_9BACT|nr:DUF4886 domain-containing protein [Hymenobacter edaphi]RAK70442.1 PEP-CTERM sorting domain-containing protein [Hymenobacter edaphi]